MELDFYQLPSLRELGLDVECYSFDSGESAARDLVSHILHEIDACGLKDMYPWQLIVYHRILCGKVDSGRRVLILPPNGAGKLEYVYVRGHDDFHTWLFASYMDAERKLHDDWLTVGQRGTNTFYSIKLATDWLIGFMKPELEKVGMAVSASPSTTTDHQGYTINYNIFKLWYEHK